MPKNPHRKPGKPCRRGAFLLLAADPEETGYRAGENPEICREMNRRLGDWLNPEDRVSLAGLEDLVISREERDVLLSLDYLK